MNHNSHQTTVFVVDDDDGVRDSLTFLLESYGIEVQDFNSTEAFLAGYQPRGRACLLLDQHLPGATGLDFLASEPGKQLDLPVILITGRGDAAMRARALQTGVVDFLEKPISDDTLVAAIARAVDGRT